MTDAPNKLADAVEAFLAAYRAKYRRTQGGVRSNAPFQTEAGEMAVALGNARAVPQPPQEPTPEAVERAAKAIQTATTGKPSLWRRIDETKRELYRKCARAALTAPA